MYFRRGAAINLDAHIQGGVRRSRNVHTDDVAAVVHIAAPGSVPGKADRVVISRSGRGVLGVGAAHRGNVLQVERPATGVRGEVSVIELPGPGRRIAGDRIAVRKSF